MNVVAESVRLVVHPVTFVNIAIDVNKLALAKCSVVFPEAFVAGSVNPNLLAQTVSETSQPLTCIGCPGFECVSWPLFTSSVWVIFGVSDSLFLLFHREVSTISPFSLANNGNLLASAVPSPSSLQLNDVLQFGLISLQTDFRI
jgi:hypothetical protein